MKTWYYSALLLSMGLLFIACDIKDCHNLLNVEFPFTLSPANDTFQVGDTIWIESIVDNLTDYEDGQTYDFSDFELVFYISLHRMDTTIASHHIERDNFTYFSQVGNLALSSSENISVVKLEYLKTGTENRIKGGVIPRYRGLYQLGILAFTEHYQGFKLGTSDCLYTCQEIRFLLNNGEENNYEFLLDHAPPEWLSTPDGFRQDGGYAFWVVE